MPAEILFPDSVRRIFSFEGLEYGSIYPTDIDAALEFSRKLFIYIECRGWGGKRKVGQSRLFESSCDAHKRSGMESFALSVCHEHRDTETVVLAECFVIEEYQGAALGHKGQWMTYIAKERPTVAGRIRELYSRYVGAASIGQIDGGQTNATP
jgi:hypothetical protein